MENVVYYRLVSDTFVEAAFKLQPFPFRLQLWSAGRDKVEESSFVELNGKRYYSQRWDSSACENYKVFQILNHCRIHACTIRSSDFISVSTCVCRAFLVFLNLIQSNF